MSITHSASVPAVRSRLRRQDPRPARSARRVACLLISVAAAVAAAAMTPAIAATGPSMILNNNAVNIVVQGPNHSLRYYWAINGTTTWHAETVAGAGSTYSAPSMILNNNAVNITAVGAKNRLKYYWAINGTTTWHPETVAGKGSSA